MNADKRSFKHGELTRQVIDVLYEVYNELGLILERLKLRLDYS